MDVQKAIRKLFLDGLEACSPARAVARELSVDCKMLHLCNQRINLSEHPVYLLSVGKAAVPMYKSAKKILADHIAGDLVIAPNTDNMSSLNADRAVSASHPLPDKKSLEAAETAINFVRSVPENGFLMVLLSGGTSSLMCRPVGDISLGDLRKTYRLLARSGMVIKEMNTVRKLCSGIKGGQLLRFLAPDAIAGTLAVSDVPKDDISVIGSGPTAADNSTFTDAFEILHDYGLWNRLPLTVRNHIQGGLDENTKRVRFRGSEIDQFSGIISSARHLSEEIASRAESRGLTTFRSPDPYNDDVETVASEIAEKVRNYTEGNGDEPMRQPKLFVFYGESTVSVSGSGKGGRNQELALRGAIKIADLENVTLLCAGTDGIDGPTDAAGAIVDSDTISKAKGSDINPQEYLDRNDSYHFHKQMQTHLKTGPTGNNLMDIVLVLVNGE